MEDIIKNTALLSTMLITIIYAVYRYLRGRKNKKIKYDAVEKLSKEIQRLKYEKKMEQMKITKERSDILYSEFLKAFCKGMEISEDCLSAQMYESYILNHVRKRTDEIMEDAIDRNNMASRLGDEWTEYKTRKFNYILTLIIRYIKEIWKDEIIGYPHDEVVEKCREKIVEVYSPHINSVFDEIKQICMKYENEIKIQNKLLNEIKDDKGGWNVKKYTNR